MGSIADFFGSKRNVLNLISVGLAAIQAGMDNQLIPPQYQVLIVTVLNLVLGTFFQGTGWPKLRANISMFLLLLALVIPVMSIGPVGCAGSKANKAVTVIEITNASINNISAALESACQEGRVPADFCAKVQIVYNRVKIADDAVIHATNAAIEAGADPQDSPDYQAAMTELTKAIGDLYKLAGEVGILNTEGGGGL